MSIQSHYHINFRIQDPLSQFYITHLLNIFITPFFLTLMACSSSTPVASGGKIFLLGDARIRHSPDASVQLFLPPESPIVIRIEPERLSEGDTASTGEKTPSPHRTPSPSPTSGPTASQRCDALETGTVDISLKDPNGDQVWSEVLSLAPPSLIPADNGFVGTLPYKPTQEGPYTLTLTWHCIVPSTSTQTTLIFDVKPLPSALKSLDTALKEHFKAGNYPAAAEDARALQQEAHTTGWLHEAVQADIAASTIAIQTGDAPAARKFLARGEATLKTSPLPLKVQAMLLYRQALFHASLGQTLKALELAVTAQRVATRFQVTPTWQGAVLLELDLLLRLGHTRAVLDRLRTLETENSLILPEVWNNVGWPVLQALEAGSLTGDARTQGLAHAERAFERSISLYEQAGRRVDRDHPLANLAGLALLKGDLPKARALIDEVRTIRPTPDGELKAYLLKLESSLALQEGKTTDALTLFTQLMHLEGNGLAEYRGWGHFGQGEILREKGALEKARDAYDRALKTLETEPGLESPLHRPSTLQRKRLWEGRALQVRLDLKDSPGALQLAERAAWRRWQALGGGTQRELPAAVAQNLEALDRALIEVERLPMTAANRAKVTALEAERQESWAAAVVDSRNELPPPTFSPTSDVWKKVPWLRRYISLPDELVIWQLEQGRWTVERHPVSSAALEEAIEQVVQAFQSGNPAPKAQWLRDLLLPVVLPESLVLVPDGALRRLPWAGLPARASTPKDTTQPATLEQEHPAPLITRSSIRLLPSLLWSPPPPGTSDATSTLVVADPGGDLPAALGEGKAVQALLTKQSAPPTQSALPSASNGSSHTFLTGQTATRAELRRTVASARLFHFAGHGRANAIRPYLTSLSLARNERLTLMEVEQLRLPGTRVFLNACGLGQTGQESGGTLGMAEGLLASGASSVIAGLWDLEEQEAQRLAVLYYPMLLSDVTPDPALALARAIRARIAQISDPTALRTSMATWSAYVVLGQ